MSDKPQPQLLSYSINNDNDDIDAATAEPDAQATRTVPRATISLPSTIPIMSQRKAQQLVNNTPE